ncbi:hypothetical protein TELCIR_23674 [Teladorsagia circumcincta]|uniref:Uncharacterized protein n=1 Tax=Teladorsagia circumcincta TaxID=45464 RepID=A0A2G9TAF3_TELCI|nr:hypothetical protein TELCIR_23674 [Teladorsagia circumcincta]
MRIFSTCPWISTKMLPSHIACESLVKQKHCVETRNTFAKLVHRNRKPKKECVSNDYRIC